MTALLDMAVLAVKQPVLECWSGGKAGGLRVLPCPSCASCILRVVQTHI